MSRRKLFKTLDALDIVLSGLMEAEANHCQIEMSIIHRMQQEKQSKQGVKETKRNPDDPAFM